MISQLLHLLKEDDQRYPDDVFANVLLDQYDAIKAGYRESLQLLEQK